MRRPVQEGASTKHDEPRDMAAGMRAATPVPCSAAIPERATREIAETG